MGLHCYICHSFLCDVSKFFCHLRKVHAVLYRGMEVKCDQSHCPRIFSSFSALKNHLMKEHRDLIDDVDVCNGEMEMDESTMLNDPLLPIILPNVVTVKCMILITCQILFWISHHMLCNLL